MISPQAGAQTTLFCANAPGLENETGLYYDQSRSKRPSRLASDATLAAELWQRSEDWIR
jgi:dehydrogenase/reductase SDR family protein 13